MRKSTYLSSLISKLVSVLRLGRGALLALDHLVWVSTLSIILHMSDQHTAISTTPPRPTSAPPPAKDPPLATTPPSFNCHVPIRSSPLKTTGNTFGRSISQSNNAIPSSSRNPQTTLGSSIGGKDRVLGIQDRLRTEVDGVVKRRAGGVLARGFILKTDHYPTGRALDLDLTIQGAPNFRAPDEEGLNVFGVSWCLARMGH